MSEEVGYTRAVLQLKRNRRFEQPNKCQHADRLRGSAHPHTGTPNPKSPISSPIIAALNGLGHLVE